MDNLHKLLEDATKAPEGNERIAALRRLEKATRHAVMHEKDKGEPRLAPLKAARPHQGHDEPFDGAYSFHHLDNGDAQVCYGAAVIAQVPGIGLARLNAQRLRKLAHEANAASQLLDIAMRMEVGITGQDSLRCQWYEGIGQDAVAELGAMVEAGAFLEGV